VRRLGIITFAGVMIGAGVAHAGVKVVEKVDYYNITGDSGDALMAAMDREGPRHGFLARAIAQTRYSLAWDLEWKGVDNRCVLKQADVTLSVHYRFPRVTGKVPSAVKRKWATFMKGVNKHERMHGRIAREMADAAYKAAMKLTVEGDPNCRRAKQELSKVVHEIYNRYEERQQQFDAVEHQPGGTVDRLVTSLMKSR